MQRSAVLRSCGEGWCGGVPVVDDLDVNHNLRTGDGEASEGALADVSAGCDRQDNSFYTMGTIIVT